MTKNIGLEILVLKKAFFMLMMVACVKASTPIAPVAPNMFDMSGHPGPTYDSTNSICLDGLLVNLGKSCKTLVEIKGKGVITAVQCHEAKKKNTPWDKYTFYVIRSHEIAAPPHTMQLCIDPGAIIYIQERPL